MPLGLDLKPILATMEDFKALQEELIKSIRENSQVQREVLAELRRLDSGPGPVPEPLLGGGAVQA